MWCLAPHARALFPQTILLRTFQRSVGSHADTCLSTVPLVPETRTAELSIGFPPLACSGQKETLRSIFRGEQDTLLPVVKVAESLPCEGAPATTK